MHRIFQKKNIPLIIFVFIELVLWILILLGPTIGLNNVIPLQYSAVCVAFLATFVFIRKMGLIHLAFLFIAIADIFLTILGQNYIVPGLAFFICASLAFAVIIYLRSKKEVKRPQIIFRIVLTIVALVTFLLIPNTNAVLVLSAVYGINLLINLAFSFYLEKRNWLFSIGLICFVLCDIFVAFGSLREMNFISGSGFAFDLLTGYIVNTSWLFYVPCLTLLVLSEVHE